METSWLLSNCSLSLLTREVIDSCRPFTCGTDDDNGLPRQTALTDGSTLAGSDPA